jgi:probable HAF family extracellular repeat protein
MRRGYIWDGGVFSEVPPLPGTANVQVVAINNQGQVVGNAFTESNTFVHPFLTTDQGPVHLGTLGGFRAQARDVNDFGQVVGDSLLVGHVEPPFPFSFDNGVMQRLETGDTYGGIATKINNDGQILYTGNNSRYMYFDGNEWIDLNDLASGPYFYPREVALGGVVYGIWYFDGVSHAAKYADGALTDLNTLLAPGQFEFVREALDANDSGQLLVSGERGSSLLENGVVSPLHELIPSDSNWSQLVGLAINNSGQIVGHGSGGPFLMSPADLPDPPDVIVGDTFPRDGIVDIQDLNNVRNHFGNGAILGPPVAGDTYPYDGVVDLGDLNRVRNYFGTDSLSAVPEPSTFGIALLSSALACFLWLRTRIRAT